jgi:hypothetical protein
MVSVAELSGCCSNPSSIRLLFEFPKGARGIMKSVSFRILVLVVVTVALLACGKKLSESERAYADTCVKVMKGAMKGEESSWLKPCECEAALVVPKLTPGELKVYLASMDWPFGKAMNQEDLSKFAADHGFTMDDYSSRNEKMRSLLPEIEKTCLERK